jgi:hypothetical protein
MRSRRRRTQAPAHLDPVEVVEHPVEDDQVGLVARDRVERLPTGGCLGYRIALVPEGLRNCVHDRRLVVDDEDRVPGDGSQRGLEGADYVPTVPGVPVSRL